MDHFQYSDSPYPIREGLVEAYRQYWQALASPGSWFSGVERIAIAAEVRNALTCPFCAERKNALSPYTLEGEHQQGSVLNAIAVDAVHRIVTDQSRITEEYVKDNIASGFSEEQYVELVAITVTVFSIDEFNRALGLGPEPLPEPIAGEPDHYRPDQAQSGTGFVSMIPEHGAVGKEADLWPNGQTANVLRALSLVPDGLRGWQRVAAQQYLAPERLMQFSSPTGRTINRMQVELVAGRVSSVNECFY
ncbi:MAG: hypothetical protein HOC23_17425 [Halieaceae bacterium]|nr:hypothetical protein [Halieaceae bacterium]